MNQIRIADFCEKYGYTKDQIRHASRTGKIQRIAKGILDEQLALQIMSYTKPLKNPKQPLHPTIEQSIQTPKKPKFLSQAWVKSMVAPASNGGKVFLSNE
ncbi:hypothetical protein [Acinetobacter ursingii]|uniref:hypothetical protein n=1 Tax=Acinetobacter ursingii TaxID=108980 RepID=UPI001D19056A|nr:hypothetical protein [Acinetobacter ursingii]